MGLSAREPVELARQGRVRVVVGEVEPAAAAPLALDEVGLALVPVGGKATRAGNSAGQRGRSPCRAVSADPRRDQSCRPSAPGSARGGRNGGEGSFPTGTPDLPSTYPPGAARRIHAPRKSSRFRRRSASSSAGPCQFPFAAPAGSGTVPDCAASGARRGYVPRATSRPRRGRSTCSAPGSTRSVRGRARAIAGGRWAARAAV